MTFIKEVIGRNLESLFEIIKAVFPILICAFITHLAAFADFCMTPKDSERYKTVKSMFIMSAMLIYVPILTLFIPIIYVQLLTFPVILVIALVRSIRANSKLSVGFAVTAVVLAGFIFYIIAGISAVLSV
ncbi:MAG: hypothetical protein IJ062_08830 [Firmicutes bacterium]|nr:hypothetical protein [Bacillota bacterium]